MKLIHTSKKGFKRVDFIVGLLLFTLSAYICVNVLVSYYTSNKAYSKLEEAYYIEYNRDEKPVSNSSDLEDKRMARKRFSGLININSDIIGWIKIPNTGIDYPVVQSKSNSFYMLHDVEKRKSRSGCIFMDYRNSAEIKDRNSMLYGQNMEDGSMFHDIIYYKERGFFEENDMIIFDTLYEDYNWEVFSVYVTGADFNYIVTDFGSGNEYQDYLNTIRNKSLFIKDIILSKDDKILTLSTSSREFENARTVVHAKLINRKQK